ncbi:MAG: translation initiation factor IF-2 [Lentisphaeraceae bacterium]|nr:translation initiation factor IF-2 [Lentisphaeraceae bacterium]
MSTELTAQDLAKEIKVTLPSLISFLTEQGFEGYEASSSLDEDLADIVRDHAEELEPEDDTVVRLKPPFIVKHVAESLDIKPNKLITELMQMGVLAAINQSIDQAKVEALCESRGLSLVVDKREKPQAEKQRAPQPEDPENIAHKEKDGDRVSRPPVVAVLGHVDHGKTSLLDALRDTTVTTGEAGGITQHTGASLVEFKGMKVTFLDTPGHAAFSGMRKRGANLTDICVLVVAADDGINAQTKEAIKIITDAKVPMIVAINKMDLPNADSEKVLKELQQLGFLTEEWGGEIGCVKVSALAKTGLEDLIERIHLEGEVNELTGNPKLPGKGIVIEAQLEQGMGATANILVQDGTFKQGDVVICGEFYGKVKGMINYRNDRLKTAGPSQPIKLLGLNGVPEVGTPIVVCKNEKEAKRISQERADNIRQAKLDKPKITSVEELMSQVQEQDKKSLRVIIKADVKGTAEAIVNEIKKIESEKINLDIVNVGVGSITETDVQLASTGGTKIIGFHVRTNPGVNKLAKKFDVDVQLYSVIYELIDKVREEMTGMLDSEHKEIQLGKAEILEIFKTKTGKICGSVVRSGKVKVGVHAKVFRNSEMIYNGSIKSLRRFKDDVKEVGNGMECGINLDNFNDFEIHDMIEIYDYEEVAAKL